MGSQWSRSRADDAAATGDGFNWSALGKKSRRQRYTGPVLTEHIQAEPGDRLELVLGRLNAAGEATAELEGAPVSVAGGLPGERVVAEVIKKFPERIAVHTVEVLESSPDRVDAPCSYFLECTGCQWQHVSYERQLALKRERVEAEIRKWPALADAEVLPTAPSPLQFGYRNHARFTIGRRHGEVGYVNATTRRFMRIDRCMLMDDQINDVLAKLQDNVPGMTQTSVRVGVNTGSVLVQPKLNNPDIDIESGQKHYEEEICGRRFRVAGSSFFQVNTAQLANMAEILRAALRLTGDEIVVDAYSGVGTFAILLAPYVRRVIAIEESSSAVADARGNAEGLDNVEFIEARSEDALRTLDVQADAVILDPPRKGCHPEVLDALKELRPARVALVSCEPEAMARDLARLCEGPFILEGVQPVDMFPQTRHVEAVAGLRLID